MAALVYREGDVVPRDATRVVVHPSVRVLPPEAFSRCRRLREVRLPEGLEGIGDRAFQGCISLRRLDCPSAVVRIGARAFLRCWRLSALELAGIVEVEEYAFEWCNSLERIGIPSRAFVVQGRDVNYRCRLVTDGVTDGNFAHTARDTFLLIAPRSLTSLPDSNLTELRNTICIIMNNGEGTEEDRLDRVRQQVRKEVRGEVSAILGLAFWKAKIDEAERAGVGADVGVAFTQGAREGCRSEGQGKGKVIAENVLPFLDGLWGNELQGGP